MRRFKKPPDKIILHCSASSFGDAETIKEWHLKRGFLDIGYHFIIKRNGTIEKGRSLDYIGSHCLEQNLSSIGVCLIGNPNKIKEFDYWFTPQQKESLLKLIRELSTLFNIPSKNVFPHNAFSNKICPGFTEKDILSWYLKTP